MNITNLNELYDKLTEVVNQLVKTAAQNTSTGNWNVSYDDVSSLISEEDFNSYFSVIAGELGQREEVLDLSFDGSEGTFDVIIGLDYCPNYEPEPNEHFVFGTKEVRELPSLSERLRSPSVTDGGALGTDDTRFASSATQQTDVPQNELSASKISHITDVSYERLLSQNRTTTLKILDGSLDDYKKAGFTVSEIRMATNITNELYDQRNKEFDTVHIFPAVVEGKHALFVCCSFTEQLGLSLLGEERKSEISGAADVKAEVLRAVPELQELNVSVGHKTDIDGNNEVAIMVPLDISSMDMHKICNALQQNLFTFTPTEREWIQDNLLSGIRDMVSTLIQEQTEGGYYTGAQKRQLDLFVNEIADRANGALFACCRDQLDGDMSKINLGHEYEAYDHAIFEAAAHLNLYVGLYGPDPQNPNKDILYVTARRGDVLEAMRTTNWPSISVDRFLGSCSGEDVKIIQDAIKGEKFSLTLDEKIAQANETALYQAFQSHQSSGKKDNLEVIK